MNEWLPITPSNSGRVSNKQQRCVTPGRGASAVHRSEDCISLCWFDQWLWMSVLMTAQKLLRENFQFYFSLRLSYCCTVKRGWLKEYVASRGREKVLPPNLQMPTESTPLHSHPDSQTVFPQEMSFRAILDPITPAHYGKMLLSRIC